MLSSSEGPVPPASRTGAGAAVAPGRRDDGAAYAATASDAATAVPPSMLGISMAEVAAFAILVECESFKGTAQRMNLTQPAVSKRILRLERALGARLVDRSVRRFTLTPAGRRFLPRARAMLEALAEHKHPRSGERTRCRLGPGVDPHDCPQCSHA